jgi:hypothetical protein
VTGVKIQDQEAIPARVQGEQKLTDQVPRVREHAPPTHIKKRIAGLKENQLHEAGLTKDLHGRDTGPGIQVNKAMAMHHQKDTPVKERAPLIPVKKGIAGLTENQAHEAGPMKDRRARDTGQGKQANRAMATQHQKDTAVKERAPLIPVKKGIAGLTENQAHEAGPMKDRRARDTEQGKQANRAMATHHQKDTTVKERALHIPARTGTAGPNENPNHAAGLMKGPPASWAKVPIPRKRPPIPGNRNPGPMKEMACVLTNTLHQQVSAPAGRLMR